VPINPDNETQTHPDQAKFQEMNFGRYLNMITDTAISFSGGDFNQVDMVHQIVEFAKKSPNLFGSHGFYVKLKDLVEAEGSTPDWTSLRNTLYQESNQVLMNLFDKQCDPWQDIPESASTPIGALKIAYSNWLQRKADQLSY